jgi:hypothetical protein
VSTYLRLWGKSLRRISSVESDKILKSRRPKRIATVHCAEHVVRDMEFWRLNSLKGSRREKRRFGPSDSKGHVAEIHHLHVKPLLEERVQRNLKLPKPRQLK